MTRIIAGIMVLLVVVAMCLCTAGCTGVSGSTKKINTTDNLSTANEAVKNVVDANNRFAFDLYRNIATDKDDNIFFSPFSISSAMAVTHEGARGETADEIQSVFHFPADGTAIREGFLEINDWINAGDQEYSLKVINALWAEKSYPFLPEYVETASRYYSAEITNLDFINSPEDSASIINNWVEEMTEGRISNLITPGVIDDMTALVITNAIYFKGTWVNQFDDYFTHEADFWITPEQSVKVQMMKRADYDARFRYTENDDVQVLGMPYKHESGKQLSMIVILPKNNNLSSVENTLDAHKLDELRAAMVSKQVIVYMPKFRLETDYLLSDSLKEMGMPTAFSTNADFSGMDGSGDLFIRDVIHKTFVDVNEAGTEAAAATRIAMAMAVMEEKPPAFAADHPFIFLIQDDETGNILFMGRLTDPPGLSPPSSPLDSLNWTIETVDREKTGVTGYNPLALDNNGNPHISYIGGDYELKYATFDGRMWKIEIVDSRGWVIDNPSLALDSSGNPHICYFDDKNEELKYAVHDGRTWKTEIVDSEERVDYSPSMAFDKNGNPHIFYFNTTDKDLKYAVYDGNTWKIETVESIEDDTYMPLPSLALDKNGNPHICYRGEDEVLKYATFDGKTWMIEIVDNRERVGYYPSMALDKNGNPLICYANGALKYAAYNGKSWNIETVDSRGGSVPSLALDSNDKPHICYHGVHGELIYAAYDGKSWNTVTIGNGFYPSLALDNNGNPHISYYLSSRHLMYATGADD